MLRLPHVSLSLFGNLVFPSGEVCEGASEERSLRYWFQPPPLGLRVLGSHSNTWALGFPSKKLCDTSLPNNVFTLDF